ICAKIVLSSTFAASYYAGDRELTLRHTVISDRVPKLTRFYSRVRISYLAVQKLTRVRCCSEHGLNLLSEFHCSEDARRVPELAFSLHRRRPKSKLCMVKERRASTTLNLRRLIHRLSCECAERFMIVSNR
ncbi:hypothetical protein IscW_ISCW006429, partial [Ixodes scapularis]